LAQTGGSTSIMENTKAKQDENIEGDQDTEGEEIKNMTNS